MKAAILCPGPSLPLFRGHGENYGLILAINRAAVAFRCDVWVASDFPLISREVEQVLGVPILFTRDACQQHLAENPTTWLGKVMAFKDVTGPESNWQRFSATAALVYAAAAGANRVDGYGMDWAGLQDFDGVWAGADRSDDRWRHEAELFSETARLLGLTWRRIL